MTDTVELRRIVEKVDRVEPRRWQQPKRRMPRKLVDANVAASLASRKARQSKLSVENRWLVENFDILPDNDTVPKAVAMKIMRLAASGVGRHLSRADGGGSGIRSYYRVSDIRRWLDARPRKNIPPPS